MEKQEKEVKSIFKRIFDILYYVVISIILIAALLYTVITFSTKDGVTSIFGYIFTSVQSDSMSGTFEKGDVIVTKKINGEAAKVSDVLSFYYMEPQSEQVIIVTHRLIEIRDDNKLVMQGDVANRESSVDLIEIIAPGDVIAKYTGTKISGLGKVTDFLKTDVGFFCCILIPVFLFLFWQIYIFVKTLIEAKTLKNEKQINDEARAIAEEMFKKMQEQQNAEIPAETPTEETKE